MSPRLALATWAPPEIYPITVTVEDGVASRSHVLTTSGVREVELTPIRAGSARLYFVLSDKAWTPRGNDERELGVQLRAVGR